jgi:hypothetical protein
MVLSGNNAARDQERTPILTNLNSSITSTQTGYGNAPSFGVSSIATYEMQGNHQANVGLDF